MDSIAKTQFATFSNSAFIMDDSFKMNSRLDRSVKGPLVRRYATVGENLALVILRILASLRIT